MSAPSTSQRRLAKHLEQVHALSRELTSAISALERNDLEQLRQSLAVQERICNELTAPGPAGNEGADTNLREEIRSAHLTLAKANQMYAALLRRSQRSVDLISALYRYCAQGSSKEAANPAKQQTWSCEV